jgi:hypothetical protein
MFTGYESVSTVDYANKFPPAHLASANKVEDNGIKARAISTTCKHRQSFLFIALIFFHWEPRPYIIIPRQMRGTLPSTTIFPHHLSSFKYKHHPHFPIKKLSKTFPLTKSPNFVNYIAKPDESIRLG